MLRHIQRLLRVYYRYQVFGDDSPELHLCDTPDPALISYHLSLAGQMIMCDTRLFNRFIDEVPDIVETFLFDPLARNDTRVHEVLVQLHFYHAAGLKEEGRPSHEERKALFQRLLKLRAYRAVHHYMAFLAPVFVACSYQLKAKYPKEARKAISLHLESTCLLDSIFKCGDMCISVILNSPLFLIHEGRNWFHRWFQLGGLPSLLYGTVSLSYLNHFLL